MNLSALHRNNQNFARGNFVKIDDFDPKPRVEIVKLTKSWRNVRRGPGCAKPREPAAALTRRPPRLAGPQGPVAQGC